MSTDDRARADGLPPAEELFEGAACGLLLTDQDGTIRRINRTLCVWLGYDAQQLVGQRRFQDLLTMGGRIFHQTHWVPLLQLQGSVAEVKLEILHRDNHSIPMVMNAVRREHAGGAFHEIAMFIAEDRHKYEREMLLARRRAEDLLAQQQQVQHSLTMAQARLRLAIDTARLYLWDVDPARMTRSYEDAVALLLGAGQPRRVDEAEYATAIAPGDREREALAFAQGLDPAGPGYSCVYQLDGIDGLRRTVSSVGRGFFDERGRLLQFVGVLQDITELSRQRAAAEDRALFAEQMVGIVSHDLRNPLSTIQMGGQLLARGTLSANQQRVVAHITSATGRAQRLIADLLDFTMARVGRGLTASPQPVDLHALVADSVDELALAFPARRIEHRREGQGGCIVDPDRLVQLVGNLVANAMAYGAPDRPVTVSSSITASSFAIAVHNEGAPIAPELIANLFEPMTRGGDGQTAARSVGLGLFIVREIARAHGGEVRVQSTADAGTVFIAEFPQQQAPITRA